METREIYSNIDGVWVMYALFAVAVALFSFGLYRNYRMLAAGRPPEPLGSPWVRLKQVILHGVLQLWVGRELYPGIMHLLIFWGFAALFLGTVVVFLQSDLGIPLMRGWFYLYFQSLGLDVLGLLCLAGVLLATVRRYLLKPDRLVSPGRLRASLGDGVVLVLLLAILVTGYLVEGMRIGATADPWAAWSPAGRATAAFLLGLGLDSVSLQNAHRVTWWLHMGLAFTFIAYIPFSKLRHMLFVPAAIYLRSLTPRGELRPIDVETAETFGTPSFAEFPWKRLLEARACTECGRCQDACPAYRTGQPLSPKALVLDLRNALERALRSSGTKPGDATKKDGCPAIEAATSESIWACVTCGACMEQCPAFIEHVPAIVDLRRYLVMEQAEYPELMQEALTSLEARGHPFRGSRHSRTDWCEGLDVRIVADGGPAEWLYWVGCAAAFDDRAQGIARAFATLLLRAGVDFAILGDEESCSGDAARRIGNEYLYQMLAQQNVATLDRYGIKKIVTTCPHCMNTLKHEYRRFGASFEVWHHTELIASLLREGRLRPEQSPVESLTLHDSCYLARHNRISREPREIIAAIPGARLAEAADSGERTFCCGAGGGHMWFEEKGTVRINHERARQLLATGASAVATACPFCTVMLSDGIAAQKGDPGVRVLDLAELTEQATRPASATEATEPAASGR